MDSLYASGAEYDLLTGDYQADLDFYLGLTRAAEGPVLELACGTGRILIPAAQAGATTWGLDQSQVMLDHASTKIADLPESVRRRITLCQGDMQDFDLAERFALVIIPFRSFLHLMTVADQISALAAIRRHLLPGGQLALNFFQPSIPMIAAHMGSTGRAANLFRKWIDPTTGNEVVCWESRRYRPAEQIIDEVRILDHVDENSQVVERTYRRFSLRWVYRFEFEHLLARTGFALEAVYGSFDRSPVQEDSSELVWIARRGEKG